MKKLLLVFTLTMFAFGLAACNGDEDPDRNGNDNGNDELLEFTLEELSEYDGLDGADAYIAVDGYVYDVTDSAQWTDGDHQGQVQAGQDLTQEMDENPTHGREMLDNVPKIGILTDWDDSGDDNDNNNGYDDNDNDDTGNGYSY